MESLTKENFFNNLKEKYPLAIEDFCIWMDKYKKENNWEELFNSGYEDISKDSKTGFSKAPKFHDLPLAIQIGILHQYFLTTQNQDIFNSEYIKCVQEELTTEFKNLDYNLYIKKYPQYARSIKDL